MKTKFGFLLNDHIISFGETFELALEELARLSVEEMREACHADHESAWRLFAPAVPVVCLEMSSDSPFEIIKVLRDLEVSTALTGSHLAQWEQLVAARH